MSSSFVISDGVAIATSSSTYATMDFGDSYFAQKLHPGMWPQSNDADKLKALFEATKIMGNLSYAGLKAAAYAVELAGGTESETQAAAMGQELEFPRGPDTEIPERVKEACCEIANVLLDSTYDPDIENQNLALVSQGFASVRATYDRTLRRESILAGVPSIVAWRLLRPFLNDSRGIRLCRV